MMYLAMTHDHVRKGLSIQGQPEHHNGTPQRGHETAIAPQAKLQTL